LRPFIGRSREVLELYDAFNAHTMILVRGRQKDGKRSIVKRLVSYLHRRDHFEQGLLVVDCKAEQAQQRNRQGWSFKDVFVYKLTQLGFDGLQPQTHVPSREPTLRYLETYDSGNSLLQIFQPTSSNSRRMGNRLSIANASSVRR
jgi:hypothetical protein